MKELIERAAKHRILSDDKSHLICQLADALERLTQPVGVEPVGTLYWFNNQTRVKHYTDEVKTAASFDLEPGNSVTTDHIYSAETVARLIAERDEWKAKTWNHYLCIDALTKERDALQEQVKMLRTTLQRITAIENRYNCGDWDEIEEARMVANEALASTEPKEKAE